jgi:molybdopterin-containing oxidoreductase family molybdopterin binding subunit
MQLWKRRLKKRKKEEMKMQEGRKGLTRRTFLKTLAATGAASALTGTVACSQTPKTASPATPKQPPEEKIYQGACRGNCASSCVINVTVREGKIVKTEPTPMADPDDTRMCVRGHAHLQRVYAADRVKYPMRRKEGSKRGAGEWEQLTWDEAIGYIAEKWQGYRQQYGEGSIGYMYGSGNLGLEPKYYTKFFSAMHSARVVHAVDYAYCFYAGPNAVGYGPWFFGSDPKTMVHSKNIFIWGANPSHSLTTSWVYLQNALDAGAKLTVIDPQFTVSASKADKFVRIKPGTDAVLAMAMINEIVEQGWQDDEYMKAATVAPFLVKESDGKYLRMSDLGVAPTEGPVSASTGKPTIIDPIAVRTADGTTGPVENTPDPVIRGSFEIEGIKVTTAYDLLLKACEPWTVERAAGVTNIPAQTIRELAKTYCDGPTCIYLNMGQDHLSNGPQAYQAMFALAFISGQMGSNGNGFNGGASFNMSSGVISQAPLAVEGGYNKPIINSPHFADAVLSGKFNGEALTMKSLYVLICNPLITEVGRQKWLEAFDKLDLIIVADVLLSDTAKYADVVLPIPHYFEKWDISYNVTPSVSINEKAIEPLYDCRTDFDIVNSLAKAMKLDNFQPMTWEEYVAASLNTDTSKKLDITWERLKEVKNIYSATDGYSHGQNNTFSTRTRRAQFYYENATPLNEYGQTASGEFDVRQQALPFWVPPVEAWDENPLHDKYPLQIMSWRSRMKTHSQFTHCDWLLELWPEPYVWINDADAAARGIKTGDLVKAFNDRGHMVCKAAVSSGIQPGTILQDHGWTKDQFIDGCYPDLIGANSNCASSHEAWYDVLCQIEKA